MSQPEYLTLEAVLALNLGGRPYLHEQGQYIGRGIVAGLSIDDDRWTLRIRDVEKLDKWTNVWNPDAWHDEDGEITYGGPVSPTTFENTGDGMISIHGYASIVHIAPPCENPWVEIDWPELDAFEGGPLDLTGLSKREQKKRLKRRKRR